MKLDLSELSRRSFGEENRTFLYFHVLQSGDYFCQVLFMAVTLPTNGRFSLSSKYLLQWSIAAGKRPSRRDRLTTRVFRGKVFLARVRTVTTGHDGKERDPGWHYSVIDSLIEVRAGQCPKHKERSQKEKTTTLTFISTGTRYPHPYQNQYHYHPVTRESRRWRRICMYRTAKL